MMSYLDSLAEVGFCLLAEVDVRNIFYYIINL